MGDRPESKRNRADPLLRLPLAPQNREWVRPLESATLPADPAERDRVLAEADAIEFRIGGLELGGAWCCRPRSNTSTWRRLSGCRIRFAQANPTTGVGIGEGMQTRNVSLFRARQEFENGLVSF